MENLTKEQQETVKTLVRLGDSLELAIETVLNIKKVDAEFYRQAYDS